jgi:Flp pilus assembly protein TadG
MIVARRRCLLCDERGSAVLEFGLLANVLIMMMLGALELAVLLWQLGTLQSVASQTARCIAIGSAACPNAQTYAVTLANSWLGSSFITAANVSVTTPTTCGKGSATGTFQLVSITPPAWAGQTVYGLFKQTVTLTACYPYST